eukprot:6166597-Pyramimonas_sp.AAC.1
MAPIMGSLVGSKFERLNNDETKGYADFTKEKQLVVSHAVAKTALAWKTKKEHKKVMMETTVFSDQEHSDDEEDDAFTLSRLHTMVALKREAERTKDQADEQLAGDSPFALNVKVPFSVLKWLKKRRFKVPSELSNRQKEELTDCFKLIDADGSGAIDVDEMKKAFTYLGVPISTTVYNRYNSYTCISQSITVDRIGSLTLARPRRLS